MEYTTTATGGPWTYRILDASNSVVGSGNVTYGAGKYTFAPGVAFSPYGTTILPQNASGTIAAAGAFSSALVFTFLVSTLG